VRSSQNGPVSGVTVTFAVEAGGGMVSAGSRTRIYELKGTLAP